MTVSDPWTQERLALLSEMRDDKPKARWLAINRLPGAALTNNAVIGKHYRLYGSKKPAKTEEEKAAARAATREHDAARKRAKRAAHSRPRRGIGAQVQAINRAPRTMVSFDLGLSDGALRIPLNDIGQFQCRWIVEDMPVMFCGRPTILGSWCRTHREVVFVPQKSRRKVEAMAA